MARVHYVRKAQQRYKMVPDIDPATGEQKVTPVMRRDGTPKTTKRGREVVRHLTIEDKTQPLPPHKCDAPGCGKTIEVGTPYKWVQPKSSAYGGRKRFRHGDCPSWKSWELSNSLSARIEQALDGEYDENDPESVADHLSSVAENIRSLGQEEVEKADNMESGFGHPTSMSDQIKEQGESLDSWADDIESKADDARAIESETCEDCSGSGKVECQGCNGTKKVDGEDCADCEAEGETDCEACEGTGETVDTDALAALLSVLDESPV